nr:HAMP domain-containing sensor histidine kinase [Labedaea rhizosphaerae]
MRRSGVSDAENRAATKVVTRSAADRLRRLRWLLTITFTSLNAIGLIVLGGLLIHSDTERGETVLDLDLHRVTSTVSKLISYDDPMLISGPLNNDAIETQCPQFAVLPGGIGTFPGQFSRTTCVPVDRNRLAGYAHDSATSGHSLSGYTRGTGGELMRVLVEPLKDTQGRYFGAVVALSDARSMQSAHNHLVVLVVGGCLLLICVLAVTGHLLSGRAIRPAAAALEQQEVLLAETAHDLRNPVASLRALAETALRNPDQRVELLPRTVTLAARMGDIIDSLLVRARLAAGVDQLALQPVWLDQLVTALVEDTTHNGAQVTVTAAPSLVRVDPSLVRRAIGNLLENALRYGRRPDQQAIVHIAVAGGRVTVADNGPGVDGTVAQDLLDRFRTGSGSTGLGLSIVRWVAEAHGGTLNVYNAEEGGAIFELDLPLANPSR